MKRREFIAALAGACVLPRSAAQAQQPMPVIGFLSLASPDSFAHLVTAFRQGLETEGFAEGRNVAIEFRWAHGQYDRLAALAAELVRQPVTVIVASGGDRPTLAAKEATSTLPIVFTGSDDPVGRGLIHSLSKPGANITGAAGLTSELEVKKLELLLEMQSTARVVDMLVNPENPVAESDIRKVEAVAVAAGKQLRVTRASSDHEIDRAFEDLAEKKVEALLVAHDPFFNSKRARLVALARKLAVPAIFEWRDFAVAGGLMSYGTVIAENYRLAGVYAGQILKGAKPAELPVQQPTKFELVINLKAAAEFGLQVPTSLLDRADEVIE